MRGYLHWGIGTKHLSLALCLFATLPLFATKGIFQGLVVQGTKREAGKYIYVAGKTGYLRRVNIQRCRVRFGDGVPSSQRLQSAAESLRDNAEIRVTADEDSHGEWIASDIVILKLPAVDQVRLRIYLTAPAATAAGSESGRLSQIDAKTAIRSLPQGVH